MFTKRELDVLHLLAKGMKRKEIAAKLAVSLSTIHTYVSSIMMKLKGTGISLNDLKNLSPMVWADWKGEGESGFFNSEGKERGMRDG